MRQAPQGYSDKLRRPRLIVAARLADFPDLFEQIDTFLSGHAQIKAYNLEGVKFDVGLPY